MSTFQWLPSFLRRRTLSSCGRHLPDDRRGSAGAFRSLYPLRGYAPGDRGDHPLEVHRGRAGADRLSEPPPASKDTSSSVGGSDPTVQPPVSRQGRRGACVSDGTFPEIAGKSALLQWRPAPTTAAVSAPIAAVWRRCGGGGGEATSLGSSRVILLHQQLPSNSNCENRGPSAPGLAVPMLLRIKDNSQHRYWFQW